jgi:hypothetical protein
VCVCVCPLLMGDVNKKRSSTPDVLRSRSRMNSDSSRNDASECFSMADTLSQQSDHSPMVSNHQYIPTFIIIVIFLSGIRPSETCFRYYGIESFHCLWGLPKFLFPFYWYFKVFYGTLSVLILWTLSLQFILCFSINALICGTTLPRPWHLCLIQMNSPSALSWRTQTYRSHAVIDVVCMEGVVWLLPVLGVPCVLDGEAHIGTGIVQHSGAFHDHSWRHSLDGSREISEGFTALCIDDDFRVLEHQLIGSFWTHSVPRTLAFNCSHML